MSICVLVLSAHTAVLPIQKLNFLEHYYKPFRGKKVSFHSLPRVYDNHHDPVFTLLKWEGDLLFLPPEEMMCWLGIYQSNAGAQTELKAHKEARVTNPTQLENLVFLIRPSTQILTRPNLAQLVTLIQMSMLTRFEAVNICMAQHICLEDVQKKKKKKVLPLILHNVMPVLKIHFTI